ncbi:hypothetical protein E4P41_20590 [Geodermatophilus sp. DF01-2]|uniref:hypothetical protein n=1 Tax=Geodermatophilus sp. DF01-2 TaxID=2559610 RepID=UPI0010733183|nr:hypothetical protein [Geodermatophilus sp. DF01_2]TFV53911.1 hypothetical protein E4P41_20590 [Geodermatophilus sp. DF01_2]
MGKRTSSHVSGDLAEVEVFGHLLRTGAAINSLTGSDTGWDLHLHVPDQIVDVDSSKSWTMSGHSAHVQVKFRSKANSARVSIGTMKDWISGSRSGTPTFVFLLDDAGGLNYLTPCDLQNVVNARPNARATTKIDLRSAPCHAYRACRIKPRA